MANTQPISRHEGRRADRPAARTDAPRWKLPRPSTLLCFGAGHFFSPYVFFWSGHVDSIGVFFFFFICFCCNCIFIGLQVVIRLGACMYDVYIQYTVDSILASSLDDSTSTQVGGVLTAPSRAYTSRRRTKRYNIEHRASTARRRPPPAATLSHAAPCRLAL